MIGARIIVVEDERILALHLRQQLVKLGYQVGGLAATGEHALRHVLDAKPDLVLMDIHIEGVMDGIETAAVIGRDHNIPIIYLTAYSEEATLDRARGTKPYGYLIKPFSERELHATIQMALERSNTERALRETEQALRQSQKMEAVGALAGGVAHDFNNLLGIIVGNLELVVETSAGDPVLTGLVQDALKAALRGASLTQQLLAYARKQPLSPQVVSLDKLVTDLAKLLRRTLGDHHIRIETDMPDFLWTVSVDANGLDTALLNLALNARHAMPNGGTLTFGARNANVIVGTNRLPGPADQVLLTVTDTGVGMTQAVLERARDPFFTTRALGAGTGLGLSMVDGFVKQSNGQLDIESAPGHGTTIKLLFPAHVSADAESGPMTERDAVPLARGNEVVAVLDRDRAVSRFLVGLLKSLRYQAIEAAEEADIVRLLREGHRVDLLLTGEVISQPDTLAAIGLQGVKILYTSAYAAANLTDLNCPEVVSDVLAKPFRRGALATAVRRLLDRAVG